MRTENETLFRADRIGLFSLAGAMLLLAGCASVDSPSTNSHAAIMIKGANVTDLVLTTREVFESHDFALARAEPDRMIFERPGTRGEQVKYGSFGSSSVVIRVKVDMQDMGPGAILLQCNVFSVRDAGQSVLEDETRLVLARSRPYRKMLEEIQARLAFGGS